MTSHTHTHTRTHTNTQIRIFVRRFELNRESLKVYALCDEELKDVLICMGVVLSICCRDNRDISQQELVFGHMFNGTFMFISVRTTHTHTHTHAHTH